MDQRAARTPELRSVLGRPVGWHGYAGPCPIEDHGYRFILYALAVPSLAEIDMDSTLDEVKAALEAHALASTVLDGSFSPPP